MSDKINKIKAIFKSFELKGSKEELLAYLKSFEEQTSDFQEDIPCKVVTMWMKNIFLQHLNYFPRAEELLDKALTIATSNSDKFYVKWELKIYMSLGYIHQVQCNYIDADYFLNKALKLAEQQTHLAKVSSKLAALKNMLNFVDKLIIGGAMANTFLKSQGIDTKGSMIEEDLLQTAADIVKTAKDNDVELLLPTDLVCAEKFDKDAEIKEVGIGKIPDNWMALDIGPQTALRYASAIDAAKTIVWNGPMGVFEMDQFMYGTKTIADAIADSSAFSIVGGGDTGLAAKKCNVADKVSYISTGGGAFLHLMEGKQLPGVIALE